MTACDDGGGDRGRRPPSQQQPQTPTPPSIPSITGDGFSNASDISDLISDGSTTLVNTKELALHVFPDFFETFFHQFDDLYYYIEEEIEYLTNLGQRNININAATFLDRSIPMAVSAILDYSGVANLTGNFTGTRTGNDTTGSFIGRTNLMSYTYNSGYDTTNWYYDVSGGHIIGKTRGAFVIEERWTSHSHTIGFAASLSYAIEFRHPMSGSVYYGKAIVNFQIAGIFDDDFDFMSDLDTLRTLTATVRLYNKAGAQQANFSLSKAEILDFFD
jgi:hypothetical protein